MKTVLVLAAALGLSTAGAMACSMQKTAGTDGMTVASVDKKVYSTVDDATTTASIARPAAQAESEE